MAKSKILILGKLPPPFFGPSVATEIILKSKLREIYIVDHFDTKINSKIDSIGVKSFNKLIPIITSYLVYLKKLKSFHPDLILIPISQSTIGFVKDSIYIFLGARSNSKVLVHLRGSNLLNWLKTCSLITKCYFEYILKKTSGGIVVGENLRFLFKDFLAPERIHVVHNGGNFNLPLLEKKADRFVILCFSNLIQSKGVEEVIDAAYIIKNKGFDSVLFRLVGAWYDEKFKLYCLNTIKSKNLPIDLCSEAIGDLKLNYFSEADIFVFAPREPEGHPWVIVEALAAGLPIISTNQGAISESVIDGENGFIVNIKQPGEIAEKIEFLIRNGDILNKMGKESRKLYESKFTEDIMINNLIAAFEKTLKLQH